MPNLTESDIEKFAIELFQAFGWEYVFGPDIAPDSTNTPSFIENRESLESVLLTDILYRSLKRINPDIPEEAINDALKAITDLPASTPDLIASNERFHRILTEGVNVTYRKNGEERGDIVKIIDFENTDKNEFYVINQFTIIENNFNKRPDVLLFVNGLPVVVMELKNPASENATIKSAYNQLQTYKASIPSLFVYRPHQTIHFFLIFLI